MEDKVVMHIFNDIYNKVLHLSEDPGQFAEYITLQIRELIGTRTVVIAVKTESGETDIFSVFPERRKEWASQTTVIKLAELSYTFSTIQFIDIAKCEKDCAVLLENLNIEKIIAFPLIAANRKIGSILLLDILDDFGIESVISLLDKLSGVLALVIRNSYLYFQMEELVLLRTEELRSQNEELLQSEEELQSLNEEYKVINEELTEALEKTDRINKELIKAESWAKKSEMKARDILQTAMDGFWIVDLKGKFKDLNEIACKMLGYSRGEMMKMRISDIEAAEATEQTKIHLEELAKKGESRFESLHRRKDGKIITVDISAKWQSAQKLIVVFIHDITERKKAEEKLRRSERELKDAQQITHIGSWYLDLETNEVTWTEELFKMYGFDPNLPVPPYTEHMKLFTPESWVALSSSLAKTAETGTPYELELRTIRKDKTNGWMWVRGEARTDSNGKIIGLWGAAQDISERKQIEQDLKIAKEKAEESDRLKSAFLANMSHEIRTPMNGILSFTSLLQEPNLTGEEQQKYIEIIQKSGDRMLSTVNDIIDISKIEAGQMTVSVSSLNVGEQLHHIYSFFNPEVLKKGMKLIVKDEVFEQEIVIQTDREKLNSILTNLVKNAIKFTQKGTIELGYELKKDNKKMYLEFYVKDTGIGIFEDRQKAIFERFVQADIEDRNALQGSGLGLAICKAYTSMLGGEIWVKSEPGVGSLFYFTLPYNGKSHTNEKGKVIIVADENMEQIKKLNIVIAEDDLASAMFLEILLNPMAEKIIITRTGEDTVSVCRNNPDIDLILMDIQMPKINGFEATRQIRKFNKEVLIIAQTAFALTGDSEKAIEAGCNDYISKPINKNELLELIQKRITKRI